MRLEVGTVRTVSEGALFAAIAACGYGLLAQQPWEHPLAAPALCAVHFVAAYGVTILAFATFARSRRTDLVKIVIMAAILGEIVQPVLGRALNIYDLASDVIGAFAVFVPSFMERFRSLVRSDPHEPFSMVYPNDRRRRRSIKSSTPSRTEAAV